MTLDVTELTKVQELIYELKVEQVMTTPVITVTSDMAMNDVKEIMRLKRISGVPVLELDQMVGIISIEDVMKAVESGDLSEPVHAHMTRNLISVRAGESVIEAVKKFRQYRVGRLPVVDAEGRLVGILTGGDITRGLLEAIRLDYHAEEISRYRASHIFDDIVSDQTSLILCYNVPAHDFTKGGEASSHIKRALYRLGASPVITRRVAIATYEAETNLIIHTDKGGKLIAEVHPDTIRIVAIDTGPGIPDVEQALRPGYSTAPDWIRELGFGAGMGLCNIQRCSDSMHLESQPGVGTRLEAVFNVPTGGLAETTSECD